MKVEIERKFLVAHDGWRSSVTGTRHLRDGLLASFGSGKIRVRIDGEKASITVKGPREGITRVELEYAIPKADAEHMLAAFCGENLIEKTRYLVPHGEHLWEVDVYEGQLNGVVHAEVEVENADTTLDVPDWIGEEVTGQPEHSKRALLRLRLAEEKAGCR